MFGGDLLHHLGRHVFCDQSLQGLRVSKTIGRSNHSSEHLWRRDVLSAEGRVGFFQLSVIFRPEKRKRRHHRAGADPGDEIELRSVAMFRPPDEQACAVGAVTSAT